MPHTRPRPALALSGAILAATTGLATQEPSVADQTTVTTITSTKHIEIGSRTESPLALGMTINDGTSSRYPSSTGPTGLAGTVTDVDVRIKGFSHERPRDVDILLEAPNGQTVVLMSDVGGTVPVSGLDLTIDDEAAAEIDPANVPQTGTWRPSNEDSDDVFAAPAPTTTPAAKLSVLDGQRPGGAWKIYVVDDTFDYFGSIAEIWIDIETSGPNLYPSTLKVSGLPSTVTDVDVTITGLRHIWATDVDLLLVGPYGQQATILSDAGIFEVNVNSVDLTFDDEAELPLPDRIVSGTFRPVNNFGADDFPDPAPTVTGGSSLSAFDGTDPNGTWSLYVVDDSEKDAGTLDGWSLRIEATGPVPDTSHPRVRRTVPGARATGAQRAADIVAVLDEPVRRPTVSAATAYVVRKGTTRHLPATVTWEVDTRRIVIDPNRPLRPGTSYRVVVTSRVTDLAGNGLDQDRTKPGVQAARWLFTTR